MKDPGFKLSFRHLDEGAPPPTIPASSVLPSGPPIQTATPAPAEQASDYAIPIPDSEHLSGLGITDTIIGIFGGTRGDYVDQTFNFLYGVGDNMSLGIGWWLRSTFFDDQADYGSSSYYIGSWVGFVADLAIGEAFKAIGRVFGKELLEQGARNAANSAGRQKWFNFLADQGGETVATGYRAAYVGNLAWANRLGLRQGYSTTIRNFDSAGSWFARTDTAVHEGFHALVGKHLPSVWKAGDATLFKIPVGAPIKYVEEVFAYAAGHGAALRLHGIPFAPIEAFGSLTAGESVTTIIFGIGVYSIYEYFNG